MQGSPQQQRTVLHSGVEVKKPCSKLTSFICYFNCYSSCCVCFIRSSGWEASLSLLPTARVPTPNESMYMQLGFGDCQLLRKSHCEDTNWWGGWCFGTSCYFLSPLFRLVISTLAPPYNQLQGFQNASYWRHQQDHLNQKLGMDLDMNIFNIFPVATICSQGWESPFRLSIRVHPSVLTSHLSTYI